MKKNQEPEFASLRKQAEELLKNNRFELSPLISSFEPNRLLHELQLHQIELEMQKEELMVALNSTLDAIEVFDFAPSGNFTLTKDGEINKINLFGAKMIDKHPAKLINSRFGFFVSDDTKPIFNEMLENVFESKGKASADVSIIVDGKLPMQVHLNCILNQNKNLCFVSMVDISDRKIAEKALKESEEKYRVFFENSTDGIFMLNLNNKLCMVNSAFAQMHGYTVEELMHMDIEKLDTPETYLTYPDRKERLLNGETLKFEVDHYTKQGNIVMHEVVALRTIIGKEDFILAFHHDITDIRSAKNRIKQKELLNRNIIRDSTDGYLLIDLKGRLLDVNKTYCRLSGYSREELLTMNMIDLEALETIGNTAKQLKNIILLHEKRFETKHIGKNAKFIDYDVNVKYDPQNEGELVIFLHDITESNKLAKNRYNESEE